MMIYRMDRDDRNMILFPSVDNLNFVIILKANRSEGIHNS